MYRCVDLLDHLISSVLSDDGDMDRERKNLAIRGSVLAYKFYYNSEVVKAAPSVCY